MKTYRFLNIQRLFPFMTFYTLSSEYEIEQIIGGITNRLKYPLNLVGTNLLFNTLNCKIDKAQLGSCVNILV